jgi:lipid-A-disaccharide synthase-like uncharacterized protein
MTRKSLTTLSNLFIGFILSILSFFGIVFLVKFFVILYTKSVPAGSSFYYQTLVDFAAFLVDFTNPVTDVCIIIAIFVLGILYSIALMYLKRNTL